MTKIFMGEDKLQSCCCCIGVKRGTYAMGALVVLSLLEELDYLNPMRLMITVTTISFFWMMVNYDCERNR